MRQREQLCGHGVALENIQVWLNVSQCGPLTEPKCLITMKTTVVPDGYKGAHRVPPPEPIFYLSTQIIG